MNYYEELGLTSSSTREEIQRAYKHLARVLHPDRYPDAKVRRVMEAQMKRLNLVHRTLTDAKRRAAYDRSLLPQTSDATLAVISVGGEVPAAAPPWKRPQLWVWAMAMLLAVALLYGVLREGVGGSSPVAAASAAPTVATDGLRKAEPPSRPRGDPQTQQYVATVRELRERIRQLEAGEASVAQAPVQTVTSITPLANPPVTASDGPQQTIPVAPAPVVHASASPPSPNRLTGRWLYVPPSRRTPTKEMYAAEYIEAVIVEQAGQLRGRYRARYRVTDRAISPEVLFQFSGEPAREEVAANWMGEGGARGEVRLKLLSENQLEVAWIASELGRRQGLGSGRAVLVRRQSPTQNP